ncbi:MAG: hypothetical protein ACFFD4_08670 [Candidatus Odinarchaeota archaeon]
MIFSGKCPKCSNSRIAGPHRIHGGDGHHIRIDLPGMSTATLDSFTCAKCGYTEFYSDQGGLSNINRSGRFIELSTSIASTVSVECRECGNPLMAGDGFCPRCGTKRM